MNSMVFHPFGMSVEALLGLRASAQVEDSYEVYKTLGRLPSSTVLEECRRWIGIVPSTKLGTVRAKLHVMMVLSKHRHGDTDGAWALMEEARRILYSTGEFFSEIGTFELLEVAVWEMGHEDLFDALALHDGVRHIWQIAGRLQTERGAELLCGIGSLKFRQGDSPGALTSFYEAQRILYFTNALQTEQGATLLRSIARLKYNENDVLGALASFGDARRILEAIGKFESEAGEELMFWIGHIHDENEDLKGALSSFEEARRIRVAMGTLESERGANILIRIGDVKEELDDMTNALVSFMEACRIIERLGMDGTEVHTELLGKIDAIMMSPADLVQRVIDKTSSILAERRIDAIKELGRHAQSRPELVAKHFDVIIKLLADSDFRARISVVAVLETLVQNKAIEVGHVIAIERLASDHARNPGVESAVEHALETIGCPTAMEALRRVIRSRQVAHDVGVNQEHVMSGGQEQTLAVNVARP